MKKEQSEVKKTGRVSCRAVRGWATLAFLISVLVPHSSPALDRAEIKDFRYSTSRGYTRVVVDLSRPVEFSEKRLSGPDRLYFDLKNARISGEIQNRVPIGDGILKAVRAGQFDPETVRIVLDLERMEDFSAFMLDDPARLVIDVNAGKQERKAVSQRTVVLDPGHGGHDPGAIGKHGLKEKDVVLDIALRVREILAKDGHTRVVLTRDQDVFVPLEERSLMALKEEADLFVSIHVNASPNRSARGIETYLQNWTDEEEAIRVAARENYVSVKTMKEKMARYRKDDYVSKMLTDLSRDYKREESLALAHYVQSSLYSDVVRINRKTADLGVKKAMFFVLMGASMPPSILAEVSFVSNPDEEKLLASGPYRGVLARSIASGIETYFSSSPPEQRTVRTASSGPHTRGPAGFIAGR